jgi:prenyltransferase beta subunit
MADQSARTTNLDRRKILKTSAALASWGLLGAVDPRWCSNSLWASETSTPKTGNGKWDANIEKGLKWLASKQAKMGYWPQKSYLTAITALAGTALICSGSTTTQGPYSKNIRRCVDFLLTRMDKREGLIGDRRNDDRYTYGHGFSMLFLSQVLGEEEDSDRRDELVEALEKAAKFSVNAQTKAGGWGYVSAKDNSTFDEGSTTITQVQGLRGCRNAGITVSKEAIEKAKKYIYNCKNKDGGISYSSRNKGSSRPAITAAALAALYNAGDYDSKHIPEMWKYCKKKLHNLSSNSGHWNYTYLYYSQVVYRQGDKEWKPFRDKLNKKLAGEQQANGSWTGSISPTYATSCNLIMMQMDKGYLPIYQK